MKFAEPIWLLAGMIACGTLVWAWRRHDVRQHAELAKFAASQLHSQLTASFSTVRRNWKRGLLLASVALLFVALSRPQAGYRWEEITRRGIEVVFAVDTSRSMLSPDVKPDRLTRAKLAVHDFVNQLNGDGVGLVAFAGSAFLQSPVTLDYAAFNDSLNALDTTVIPHGGTDIASAIRETQAALQDRASTDKVLILLTDGEDLEGSALTAAKAAAKDGLKIYTVGVGTANGDLIPLPAEQGGGFVKDEAGNYVKSALDEKGLKEIAEVTGGLYAPLGVQGEGLETIYQEALAPMAKHDLASRQHKVYTERFQWPLAVSLGLLMSSLMIGTRRRVVPVREAEPAVERAPRFAMKGAMAAFGLLLFAPLSDANASTKTAQKAYQEGDFATAQKEYTAAAEKNAEKPVLQFNAGAAAYKAGDYAQAAEAFQKSLAVELSADPERIAAQADAYYNLGNTLYRVGQSTEQSNVEQTIQQWEEAVKAYEAALELRPDEDTQFNHDLVKRKLEELKKQQEQQQQQEQEKKDQQQQQDQQNQDQNQDPQDKQDHQDQSGSGSDSEQKEAQEQNSDDQKQSGEDSNPQNKDGQDEKQNADSKPGDEQNKNEQSNEGSKPNQPEQSGKEEQPANQGKQPDQGQPEPQQNGQPSPGAADQQKDQQAAQQAAEMRREPGQMSKEEARALLDSLDGEQRRMPVGPVSRAGSPNDQPEKPRKNW